MIKTSASVAVVQFRDGSVSMTAFPDIKQMVQNYLTMSAAIAGDACWASDDHLAVLKETLQLLERTIEVAEKFQREVDGL